MDVGGVGIGKNFRGFGCFFFFSSEILLSSSSINGYSRERYTYIFWE